MAIFTTEALEFLRTHHGIATSAELQQCGLTAPAVRSLIDAGNLTAVLKGVYRIPAVTLDEAARCAAVCAAHPSIAISGPTAGRLWGLRRLPRDHRIHVLAPPASHPSIAPWVVPYRTAAVHPADVMRRSDGINVTSRARTALDLARFVGPTDLLSIIEQVIRDGDHTDDELRAVAVDWMSPQRPWIRQFLELLDSRLHGGAAESHGEAVLGDALSSAGLAGLVRQYRIDLPGYGPARFDLAVPAVQLAIEVDLHPTHHETNGRRRDASRDTAAVELGWTVERVVEVDFGARLPATTRRIIDLAAALRLQR